MCPLQTHLNPLKWKICSSLHSSVVDIRRDLPFFTPRLEYDSDLLFSTPSLSPLPGPNIIEDTLTLLNDPPLNPDQFSGKLGNPYQHSHNVDSPVEETVSFGLYSSPDSTRINHGSSEEQGNRSLSTLTASSLSASSTDTSYPPEKPAVKRKRTRRPSTKPILRGPNPHGRTGKPRCDFCRSHRQGVRSNEERK